MTGFLRRHIRRPRSALRKLLAPWIGNAASVVEYARGAAMIPRWQTVAPATATAASPTNPLEEYFDGVTQGPGVWKWRHYFDLYHRHLQRFVGMRPIVVEVGVYSGGSMPMWHAYFGPGTHVHGIDIEPACRGYENAGTTIHIGDQADPVFWRTFTAQVPQVDILIDDGGHQPEQQMATIEAMLPHLRPGGVYICEDITGTANRLLRFVHGISDSLHAYAPRSDSKGHVSPATSFQADIHSLHIYPFVVVIEKRAAAMPSFSAPKHGTQWQPFL